MSLELALQQNTDALHQLIALLSDPSALKAASAPVATTEQKKEKPAAEKSEKKQSAGDVQTAETTKAETTEAAKSSDDKPQPTYDDVKAAVIKLSQAKGRDTVVDVLSRFGVTKAPDLKPDQYAGALEKIESVIAGGEV